MQKVKHILIIDDDEDLRELMTEVLVGEGYAVSIASDGQAGLDILTACQITQLPDLIILDSQMPRLNGAQFIEALANLARPELKKIPIIFSSGITEVNMDRIPPASPAFRNPMSLPNSFKPSSGFLRPS